MENLRPISAKSVKRGTLINLEKGKLPPQAVDLEEAVLGAMMIDKKGVDDVIDILHADAFYKQAHQDIFDAMFTLFNASEPIDLLTVSNQLRKDGKLDGVGGDFYLVNLTQKVHGRAPEAIDKKRKIEVCTSFFLALSKYPLTIAHWH